MDAMVGQGIEKRVWGDSATFHKTVNNSEYVDNDRIRIWVLKCPLFCTGGCSEPNL
jgi:hypothetical protein